VGTAALHASLALVAAARVPLGLTARQKAALVVVSGLPAPQGVGGVILRRGDGAAARPARALVFADQEGGLVKAFPDLPPWRAASAYTTQGQSLGQGRATGVALRRAGVDVDLAPVLDAPSGPLGSRQFRRASLGVAFARGLATGGVASCAKHFPGLGSARTSTDDSPHVDAVVRASELRGFRDAVRAGVPCVMVGHAFYRRFGRFRASIEPATYRLLRSSSFRGVAIADSLSIVNAAPVERWSRQAVRAGADLVLFTDPVHARRAIAALVPLARRGELDEHVRRVLAFRGRFGRR